MLFCLFAVASDGFSMSLGDSKDSSLTPYIHKCWSVGVLDEEAWVQESAVLCSVSLAKIAPKQSEDAAGGFMRLEMIAPVDVLWSVALSLS